ncbi:hypothetical protein BHE74_00014378 [Ensete ventricosum]|uniref:Uncharacterized protein n=1 Tax=Ensete ventricosum TaxID=4639 RepID=A0A444BW36_ENSVE|nr:hypothetical protein B296_00030578 [Ensete ventricosum]RWV77853.1 hypothetical protein GW17_00061268 [Ensete ventricosum]RWW77461.1 hypothetical protein BHE74_00014378 [Ensete ventricosum]RZS08045.1 hypothetical protein BHM03_00038976 [Ensete ventricosum]
MATALSLARLPSPPPRTTSTGRDLSSSFLPAFSNSSSSSTSSSLPFLRFRRPLPAVRAMAPPKPSGKAKKGATSGGRMVGIVKLALEAGKATPAPPVGPALGSKGVNIMAFCKEYNAKTADKAGYVIPVLISVCWITDIEHVFGISVLLQDKSFTFILKTPPASVLLLKAAGECTFRSSKRFGSSVAIFGESCQLHGGVEKGSKDPKLEKVGKVTIEQLRAIATEKLPDLNCTTIESAMRIIAGTAANMGIDVDPPVLEPKKKAVV